MAVCPHCGDTEASPGSWCPGCGMHVPEEAPTLVDRLGAVDGSGTAELEAIRLVDEEFEAAVEEVEAAAEEVEVAEEFDFDEDAEPDAETDVVPMLEVSLEDEEELTPELELELEDEDGHEDESELPTMTVPVGPASVTRAPVEEPELPSWMEPDAPEPAPVRRAPLDLDFDEHAQIQLSTRYQYSSLPADDPPLIGILLGLQAFGEPLVGAHASAVAHVIVALDLSASMNHPDKYPVLCRAVESMFEDLHDPEASEVLVSIVIFSNRAQVLFRAVPSRSLDAAAVISAMEDSALRFGDYTDIPGALSHAGRIAYDQWRLDKTLPIRLYLMTDGRPQDQDGSKALVTKLAKIPADIHALAFGVDADVALLQDLFAGCRGGTVKSVRKDTIGFAFERIAVVAKRVVATRCLVDINLASGVVGGDAYRYRPARVRFPQPCFVQGKRFSADLGNIETGRHYQLLFHVRPPESEEGVTRLGTVRVRIPGYGGPIEETLELSLSRTAEGTLPGDEDQGVRTARDILDALTDADPQKALRALRLRQKIYEHEKRDPALLEIIDKAISLLETTGSLDGLSTEDHATLMAHTCTSGFEVEEPY